MINWLDDCLICPNISLIALKTSKFPLPGSILIDLQPSFCSIAFLSLFPRQYFCHYDYFYQFVFQVYSHKNVDQSYNRKKYIVFACFLL